MKLLSHTLHSDTLERHSLADAIRALARRLSGERGRAIEVFIDDAEISISPEAAMVLYNAAEVALMRAVQFHTPFPVLVTLKLEHQNAVLEVSGDVPSNTANVDGSVQDALRCSTTDYDTLHSVGGTYHTRTEVDLGTTVVFSVPCSSES